MSAICFLIATILAVVLALGGNIHNGLYWVLAAVSAGLLCWAIGLPGWSVRGRV
jgi:hypothetical protein